MQTQPNQDDSIIPRHLCIFYSHPWALHLLKSPRLGIAESRLVVELAQQSMLAPALGLGPRARVGLPALLSAPSKLAQLVERPAGVTGDFIFAPQPSATPSLQIAGLGVLPYLKRSQHDTVTMIHAAEHEAFVNAFAYANRFLFLWDLADPQTYLLPQIATALSKQRLLTRESWGGFFWYTHPQRKVPNIQHQAAHVLSSLRPFQSVLEPAK